MTAGIHCEVPSVRSYYKRLYFAPEIVSKLFSVPLSASAVILITEEGINTDNPFEDDPNLVCYYGSTIEEYNNHLRVCHSELATGIVSLLVAVLLIILDLTTPCFITPSWRQLITITGAITSLIMAIIWTVSSVLLLIQFIDYCDKVDDTCNKYSPFYYLLTVSGICALVWISTVILPILRAIKKAVNSIKK
ncbi:uncharacterized protein [Dysidea avara]|uniref:uncharacterized protein n=1 Tax=Dysidea avara TaxID=196820 RepID=UPI0033174FC6